jgi:hypothetical protein
MGTTQTKQATTTMTTISKHIAVHAFECELGEFINEHQRLKSVIASLIIEQSNADPSMLDYDTLPETIKQKDLVVLSINKLKELIEQYK